MVVPMAMKLTPTRQKWFDLLARWRASGLDAAAFVAGEDESVTERRLLRWQWKEDKLRRAEARAVKPTFIRLERTRVSKSVVMTGLEVMSTTGRLVRVPVGFDALTLTRLLVVVDGGAR